MKIYQKPRYHEWRWRNLVGPLVNKDGADRMLLDIGCNAGFYMKKTQMLGYKTLGVEIDDDYISQAPKNLEITKADINYYKPHCAYLTLLLCVHYHQSAEQVEALLNNLLDSTAYMIVMGRNEMYRGRVKTYPDLQYITSKLKAWKINSTIKARQFYSILVKNPFLEELGVEELYQTTYNFVLGLDGFDNFVPAFEEFVKRTLDDFDYDHSNSDLVKYFKRRKIKYPLGYCWNYKVLINELKEHGIHTALRVKGRIKDGFHRLIILRELGYKRVVCKI